MANTRRPWTSSGETDAARLKRGHQLLALSLLNMAVSTISLSLGYNSIFDRCKFLDLLTGLSFCKDGVLSSTHNKNYDARILDEDNDVVLELEMGRRDPTAGISHVITGARRKRRRIAILHIDTSSRTT